MLQYISNNTLSLNTKSHHLGLIWWIAKELDKRDIKYEVTTFELKITNAPNELIYDLANIDIPSCSQAHPLSHYEIDKINVILDKHLK